VYHFTMSDKEKVIFFVANLNIELDEKLIYLVRALINYLRLNNVDPKFIKEVEYLSNNDIKKAFQRVLFYMALAGM